MINTDAVLNEVHAHIALMADVESRVNSIVAVTGMGRDEVYHGAVVLYNAAGGVGDILELLDWIYRKVAQGQTMKELVG